MPADLHSEAFAAALTADLAAAPPLSLELSPVQAFGLAGYLQLALRHPGARGESSRLAAAAVRTIAAHLGAGRPALARALAAGADPRHDTAPPAARGEAAVRPTVVTLCGPMRFLPLFRRLYERESRCGRIVLAPACLDACAGHAPEEKALLDELHLRKIDLSDEVLVLDACTEACGDCGKPSDAGQALSSCCRTGLVYRPYVGHSTRREVAYAEAAGKRVRRYSQEGGA